MGLRQRRLFNIWRGSSFIGVLLLAGLNAIPPELLEYAQLESKSAWRRFRLVTVPLLKPFLALAAFLSLTSAFADLANVWMLTARPHRVPGDRHARLLAGRQGRSVRVRLGAVLDAGSFPGGHPRHTVPTLRSAAEGGRHEPETLVGEARPRGPRARGRRVLPLSDLFHAGPVAEERARRTSSATRSSCARRPSRTSRSCSSAGREAHGFVGDASASLLSLFRLAGEHARRLHRSRCSWRSSRASRRVCPRAAAPTGLSVVAAGHLRHVHRSRRRSCSSLSTRWCSRSASTTTSSRSS